MSINCYSGLQGSGKSYEVVSSIIVPAVTHGRRVVTNISGIDNDGIRAYCSERFDVPIDNLGFVLYATNEQVSAADFFPTEHSHMDDSLVSLVLPGDLVAIDEAYKIWGSDVKILNQHKVFFREHRHYVHKDTGVSCDLVLMTQDIGDLHRMLKVVIEQSFKTHKAKGIGRSDLYTITMWEGWKQTQKGIVKDWTQKYNPEIFPLYKSYAGDQQGKEVISDKRQNVLSDKRLVYKLLFLLLAGVFAVWKLWHFFGDKINSKPSEAVSSNLSQPGTAVIPKSDFSPDWRIVGVISIGGVDQVVLSGPGGMRVEQMTLFKGAGLSLNGVIDGKRVTRFTGLANAIVPSDSKKGIVQ